MRHESTRRPRVRSITWLTVMAASALMPGHGAAQAAPLVIEARAGGAVPLGSFADGTRPAEGVAAGPTFGANLAFSGSSRRTVTIGFSQHRFGCRDAGCRVGGAFVATGFDAGFRVNLATSGNVIPWIRAAALSTRVELDDHPGWPGAVSELGFGGEVGVGLYVGTFDQVALNPAVRAAAANTRLPGGRLLRMRYLVADLGLAVAF